jgi:predicted phosphodiesterase
MKIQYLSDTHLEFETTIKFEDIIVPNAPYLALCGDIGHPNTIIFKDFIDYCSKRWEHVFYVTGNHDYYNKIHTRWRYKYPKTMEQIEKDIEELFKNYTNVHYLQKKQFDIPNTDYVILGCTLWTHIQKKDYVDAHYTLNDFKYICKNYTRFSVENLVALHENHSTWILERLKYLESIHKKAIVLTHHLPTSLIIHPKYIGNPNNYLYYSELTEHLDNPSLKAWICGHSHSVSRIIYRKGVKVMMNCKGYPRENTGYTNNCIYEINEKEISNDSEEVDFM